MAQTGKKFLLPFIIELIKDADFTPIILTPNSKMVHEFNFLKSTQSIYPTLFDFDRYKIEKINNEDIKVFQLKKDFLKEITNPLIILLEAHLLNDNTLFDDIKFGSGSLINDLMDSAKDTPFLIIGDPYQIIHGNKESSLVCGNLKKRFSVVTTYELKEQFLPQSAKAKFQLHLCEAILNHNFTELKKFEDDELIFLEDDSEIKKQILNTDFCYLVATNKAAKAINDYVKENILQNGKIGAGIGDKIDFYNQVQIKGLEHFKISNGATGVVTRILNEPYAKSIRLKGRDSDTVLTLQQIVISVSDVKNCEIEYLVEFFGADKAKLSSEYRIAAKIIAEQDAKTKIKELENYYGKDSEEFEKEKFNIIQSQPTLAAAKIRPAFATTVHRGQGRFYATAALDATPMQHNARANEDYFRWLYTATCIAKKLQIINFHPLTKTSKTQITESAQLIVSQDFSLKNGTSKADFKVCDPALSGAFEVFLNLFKDYELIEAKESSYLIEGILVKSADKIRFKMHTKASGQISKIEIMAATSQEAIADFKATL